MNRKIIIDTTPKTFPLITFICGIISAALIWIFRLNSIAVISVGFMIALSLIMLVSLIAKKKLYLWMLLGYILPLTSVIGYYTAFGADYGFGAFTTALAGFKSAANYLFTSSGTWLTRLGGNMLIAVPCILIFALMIVFTCVISKKVILQKILSMLMSVILVLTTVTFLLTMNLRSQPKTQRLWDGQDDYLRAVDRNKTSDSPNVLFILMDDLGYGDISLNGSIYDTPNIDSIGQNGARFTNFYSSYSVCSPSRFAALTGRYPYRGFADNVLYPTVNSTTQFASTRLFNSFEMGGNADGMLGDEITIAETLHAAGYATGCFGKWHLGDYGEYLPTNQGFDYFYGSHYVNDMKPFYHVREQSGEYEIVHGYDELKDQSKATEWIYDELEGWITETASSGKPFFAYYASPWPHAPVYAGDDYDGVSGMGTYVDCITEFDHYLGQLFDKLEDIGELDNTIIVFTSDNGPALEGSASELRGGKYLAYEGGQKVPFLIRWDKGGVFKKGTTFEQSATLVDLYPTLVDLCSITDENGKKSYLPKDRIIDGVSMLPVLSSGEVIHTKEHPILYMKRERLKAIQYTVDTDELLSREEYKNYDYDVLTENKTISFKYFQNIQNDNSAFFDKFRKNWLHILNDDSGENYNRASVYPSVAQEMSNTMTQISNDMKNNRRGVIE